MPLALQAALIRVIHRRRKSRFFRLAARVCVSQPDFITAWLAIL